MKKILFALSGLLMLSSASAQKFPFPQNVDYEYGFQSANIDNNNVQAEYSSWRFNYYRECGTTEARVIDIQNGTEITVSEGIGYGMLITAYFGDKSAFDKLWTFYKNRRNSNGLMNWKYTGCNTLSGANAATDADLDAAMALLVANHQWADDSHYSLDLDTLLRNIQGKEFVELNGITFQYKGDVDASLFCLNLSYYSPGYYRAFARYQLDRGRQAEAQFWEKAATDAYYLLQKNANKKTGLVSAWTDYRGGASPTTCSIDVSGGGTVTSYQYDACRTPWRVAVDYLWWGEPKAKMFLSKLVDFVNTSQADQGGWYGAGGIHSVVDGYEQNGNKFGRFVAGPFTGSFALSAMATNQYNTDVFMKTFAQIKGDNYFNTSITLLYKLLASGNFWNPYAQKDCLYPSLGTDQSLCGLNNITLNAEYVNVSSDKLIWYVNGEQTDLIGASIKTDTSAYYSIKKIAGACSTYATVRILAEIPQPFFESQSTMCGSNSVTLALPPTFNDQFKYFWTFEDKIIPGAYATSLVTGVAGVYKAYVYTDKCPAKYGRAYLSSSFSAVDKPFSIIPAGESITISASTATDVEWCSDAAGTNKIGTGRSLTVKPTVSSTYYMKDRASGCALSPVKVYLSSDCGDMDGDGVDDCADECPTDADKALMGKCGCNFAETCVDCNGVAWGNAIIDVCNNCVGGNTGKKIVSDVAKCTVNNQPIYANPFVQISPIPTKSDFVVSNKTDKTVTVIIYSCSGRVVADFALATGESATVGNDFVKGMYLADVKSEGAIQSFKLVKE